MSLKKKLETLKAGFKKKAPIEAQEIMQRATEDLKNSGILDHTVQVGKKAPEFALKNTEGKTKSLDEFLKRGSLG